MRPRLVNGETVVAVHLGRFPSEGFELFSYWVKRGVRLAHPFQAAEVVQINEHEEVIQAQIRGHHGTLPRRAFLELAIREQREYSFVGAKNLLGVRHACRDAHAMAE